MFSSNTTQVSNAANYIEDVFSTWLYTGNGSTQTITNGIDLAGDGGLVWTKARVTAGFGNELTDTVRGAGLRLISNTTGAQGGAGSSDTTGFTSSGFQLTFNNGLGNLTGKNYASWTFRKQPKFFDVVTYTGNGASYQDVSHSLGSTPGCIMVKCTSTGSTNWMVAHRASALVNANLILNSTSSAATIASETIAYSSVDGSFNGYFRVLNDLGTADPNNYLNVNGATYVAYLFAHNAGGFGLTGTDNVISCGSFTTNASGGVDPVNLGYEPQWILFKRTDGGGGDWQILDVMRPWNLSSGYVLNPNNSNSESDAWGPYFPLNSTGFSMLNGAVGAGWNYIYIAIRRGPMKVPTSGTSVFSPNQTSGTTGTQITTSFPVDWQLLGINAGNVYNQRSSTRLTGVNTDGSSNSQYLVTSNTNAEAATGSVTLNWGSTGFQVPSLNSGSPTIFWNFGRAPSFFDEVCYTGTGSTGQVVNHNLAATPEMVIIKRRDGTFNWFVYQTGLSYGNSIYLNQNSAQSNDGGPAFALTSTTITFDRTYVSNLNTSGGTYVAYLFATCAGVSKVGSYTGTGATQTISCGFTGGARFVLIKRTDSTGDWYVWDTARGMVSGTDPSLLLNSSAAEVNANSIYTTTGGFQIVSTAAGINASGGSYIYFSVA